jgi:DNA ligase 1
LMLHIEVNPMMPSPMLGYSKPPKQFDTNNSFEAFYSEKMDGFRALIFPNGVAYSRVGNVISQPYLQARAKELSHTNLVFDCEIWTDKRIPFNKIASYVSTEYCKPNLFDIDFWCFDCIKAADFAEIHPSQPFRSRLKLIADHFVGPQVGHSLLLPQEALEYYNKIISIGGEGLIGRNPNQPYKHGRSTEKEWGMFKMKCFQEDVGTIIDLVPLKRRRSDVEASTNPLGYARQSTKQGDFEQVDGMLGCLVVKCPHFEKTFEIGTGFTNQMRVELMDQVNIGKQIKFTYQPCGTVEKPRCPSFKGLIK